MTTIAPVVLPFPPVIAVFTRDVLNNNAAIVEFNIIWSEMLRVLTDRGFEMLKTELYSVPGFHILTNWATPTRAELEVVVATAIVRNIRDGGGDFYQFDVAAKSWGMTISNGAAIAYAKIPLTAQYTAELEERSKARTNEWKTYIKTSRDVGLVTLIRFHQTTDSLQWACNFSKFLLIPILVIQFIVPIVVAISTWRDYGSSFDGRLFPKIQGAAEEASRIDNGSLAGTVACIYFLSLVFRLIQKVQQSGLNLTGGNITQTGGIIMYTKICDRFMSFVYEPLAYLVNLWYVFLQPDTYTIVFSATALQFILDLDDLFKAMFINIFPPNFDYYMALNNEENSSGLPKRQVKKGFLPYFHFLELVFFSVNLVCCVVAGIGIFYLPIFKPSVI